MGLLGLNTLIAVQIYMNVVEVLKQCFVGNNIRVISKFVGARLGVH